MKSAVSLTLIVCLVGSALPVTAQEPTRSFDLGGPASPLASGPLARAATREAVRLPPAGDPTPAAIDAIQQGINLPESNWSLVRSLAPGTDVIVTVRGSQPGKRYVVHSDESDLTVLNVADPTLPPAATHLLLDVVAHHPKYFQDTQTAGGFLDNNVRVGREGVFVANRKVADLGQVVETISRNDVAEIRGPVRVRGSVHGAILGTWLGSGVGLAFGTSVSGAALGWSLLTGLTFVGGLLGYRHRGEGVVYRAP